MLVLGSNSDPDSSPTPPPLSCVVSSWVCVLPFGAYLGCREALFKLCGFLSEIFWASVLPFGAYLGPKGAPLELGGVILNT